MTDKQLRQLFNTVLGGAEPLDLWTKRFDFGFWAWCRPKNVERAAHMIRESRFEIANSVHVLLDGTIRMNGLPVQFVALPYFACLERDRSLVIPRPKFVSENIFEAAIMQHTGDLLSFPKRKPQHD